MFMLHHHKAVEDDRLNALVKMKGEQARGRRCRASASPAEGCFSIGAKNTTLRSHYGASAYTADRSLEDDLP